MGDFISLSLVVARADAATVLEVRFAHEVLCAEVRCRKTHDSRSALPSSDQRAIADSPLSSRRAFELDLDFHRALAGQSQPPDSGFRGSDDRGRSIACSATGLGRAGPVTRERRPRSSMRCAAMIAIERAGDEASPRALDGPLRSSRPDGHRANRLTVLGRPRPLTGSGSGSRSKGWRAYRLVLWARPNVWAVRTDEGCTRSACRSRSRLHVAWPRSPTCTSSATTTP